MSEAVNQTAHAPAISPTPAPVGNFRWTICALLFFAATVNYIDRQVIGLLKPTLQGDLHWSEIDYANIVFAFQLAYAAGQLLVGRVMDWLGTRRGFSLSVLVWSLAAMSHAFVRTVFGFGVARFFLGIGESGNFPAAIKTVAEWFPKKERAFATGLLNCGTNVGAILTPLIVPFLIPKYGWQGAFLATGALGLLWIVAWVFLYRPPEQHPRLLPAELAYIRSDPPDVTATPPRWTALLRHRQLWAVAVGKGLTDPIWYVYLFWLPDFLYRTHHVNLTGMFLPLLVIYNAATVGSIGGGWLSSFLLRRGWSVNAARKTAMLICAVSVLPMMSAAYVSGLWEAVALISLAVAAHQGWSANIYTTASDMFPRSAVGTVIGFGGMTGAIGGMLIAKVVGYILQWTGSYFIVFLLTSLAYSCALLIIQLLVPRLEPASLDNA